MHFITGKKKKNIQDGCKQYASPYGTILLAFSALHVEICQEQTRVINVYGWNKASVYSGLRSMLSVLALKRSFSWFLHTGISVKYREVSFTKMMKCCSTKQLSPNSLLSYGGYHQSSSLSKVITDLRKI